MSTPSTHGDWSVLKRLATARRSRALVLEDCRRISRLMHFGVPAEDLVFAIEEAVDVWVEAHELDGRGTFS